MSGLEERMARLEGADEQINFRLERLENRVDAGFIEMRGEIGGLRGEMRSQLFWILGLLIPMWITIIATLLLRG